MSLKKSRDVQKLRELSNNWLVKKTAKLLTDYDGWLLRGDDRFHPPRKNFCTGKERILDVPKRKDMSVYKLANRSLQMLHLHHRNAHGGVSGRSSFTSAAKHLNARFVVTTDVKDCLPSINTCMFRDALLQLGLLPDAITRWSMLLMCRERIPQGCQPPKGYDQICNAIKHLDDYCDVALVDFGPLRLKSVMDAMVNKVGQHGRPLSRKYFN